MRGSPIPKTSNAVYANSRYAFFRLSIKNDKAAEYYAQGVGVDRIITDQGKMQTEEDVKG